MILKIFCITLLVLICIVVIVLGTILFVPVRYQIHVMKEEKKKFYACGKITWFLRLLCVRLEYYDEEWHSFFRPGILGESRRSHLKKKNSRSTASRSSKQTTDSSGEQTKRREKQRETKDEKEKLEYTAVKIYDRMKKIYSFLTEEKHRRAVKYTKDILMKHLEKWKPYHLSGFVRYGFEDPYNTGRVLAVLGVLYPFYGEALKVYPEFEQEIMEMDLKCEGKITIYSLCQICFQLFKSNDVKTTVKDFRRLKNGKQ